MKLKEFVENISLFIKDNPDALELDVITSKDDEGNGYNYVVYEVSKGYINEDNDYTSVECFEDCELDIKENEINAVCLN